MLSLTRLLPGFPEPLLTQALTLAFNLETLTVSNNARPHSWDDPSPLNVPTWENSRLPKGCTACPSQHWSEDQGPLSQRVEGEGPTFDKHQLTSQTLASGFHKDQLPSSHFVSFFTPLTQLLSPHFLHSLSSHSTFKAPSHLGTNRSWVAILPDRWTLFPRAVCLHLFGAILFIFGTVYRPTGNN